MENNLSCIQQLIDYIDLHLDEPLDLDTLASQAGYSKYHMHRMFTAIVGFPIHIYIQRRRLTEAGRLLLDPDCSILDIAIASGYETQRSFSKSFKALFKCSPKAYRKHHVFLPLQLKFDSTQFKERSTHMVLEIKQTYQEEMQLIRFSHDTKKGFFGIGRCWHQLHAKKERIPNRCDPDFLIGVNDYSSFSLLKNGHPAFIYYAAAQVAGSCEVPKGMTSLNLPASCYVVFCFRGHCQDSMESISNYIYKEWLPHATCRLNENARYDFVKYGEAVDESGNSAIEYWVPILDNPTA